MKKTLTLILASTAITAAVGIPAFSAMRDGQMTGLGERAAAIVENGKEAVNLILVSDDDDDGYRMTRHGDDDDHGRYGHDDDDECDDDDGACMGGAQNAAPAGTTTPPKNGLITDGATPQVKVN